MQIADRMRREHQLPTGTAIKGSLDFVLGGADMPLDPPPDWQPKSLSAKIDAGADFVQTQFCMDATSCATTPSACSISASPSVSIS